MSTPGRNTGYRMTWIGSGRSKNACGTTRFAKPSYTTNTSTPRSLASTSACLNSSPSASALGCCIFSRMRRRAPRIAPSISRYTSSPYVKTVVVVPQTSTSAGAERGNEASVALRRLRIASAVTSTPATVTGAATATTSARESRRRAVRRAESADRCTHSP